MSIVPPILPPTDKYDPFPPDRGVGVFPSAGDIDIWWKDPDIASVFNLEARRQNSYHFFGEDTGTTVWRSAPLTAGSLEDVFGVPIGPPESELVISNSDIRRVPQAVTDPRAGAGDRRRIYAELHSLRMRGEGAELLAGEPFLKHIVEDLGLTPTEVAQVFRRSYGEIISWDLTGDMSRDFPADNHFNVFFAVKFEATRDFPAFTVFNKEPLVVVDLGITQVPPLKRVTIPQFPYDMPSLFYVRDPLGAEDLSAQGGPGMVLAGRGGCCAHAVAISADLFFRPVNFSDLAGPIGIAGQGAGIEIRAGTLLASGSRGGDFDSNRSLFRKTRVGYIDGVFVPNGATQISSTGLTVVFEDTSAGGISDAVRDGISSMDASGKANPIDVQAPTDALAYQAPQNFGLGLGPNAGITFDIAALRKDNPDFYLVNLVALEGMSRESPRHASVRLRVLVDGVEVPFASKLFKTPGASAAVSVDLQTAERFVTLVSTSTSNAGNGVFGLFQLRGFGALSGDRDIEYCGPARPARPAPKRTKTRRGNK